MCESKSLKKEKETPSQGITGARRCPGARSQSAALIVADFMGETTNRVGTAVGLGQAMENS